MSLQLFFLMNTNDTQTDNLFGSVLLALCFSFNAIFTVFIRWCISLCHSVISVLFPEAVGVCQAFDSFCMKHDLFEMTFTPVVSLFLCLSFSDSINHNSNCGWWCWCWSHACLTLIYITSKPGLGLGKKHENSMNNTNDFLQWWCRPEKSSPFNVFSMHVSWETMPVMSWWQSEETWVERSTWLYVEKSNYQVVSYHSKSVVKINKS